MNDDRRYLRWLKAHRPNRDGIGCLWFTLCVLAGMVLFAAIRLAGG